MVVIIDYEAGNLRSVANAFEAIGHPAVVTDDPERVRRASAIVLPGVGAFGDGMASLKKKGLIDPLEEAVLQRGVPYLGICLGMQFLARQGEEMGLHKGLGWIDGTVRQIKPESPEFRIPHIGWNDIRIEQQSPLFINLSAPPIFYFVHSYHLLVGDGDGAVVTSSCEHGTTVTASVQKDNILGVQFHPEKSQAVGLKVLENFVGLI